MEKALGRMLSMPNRGPPREAMESHAARPSTDQDSFI